MFWLDYCRKNNGHLKATSTSYELGAFEYWIPANRPMQMLFHPYWTHFSSYNHGFATYLSNSHGISQTGASWTPHKYVSQKSWLKHCWNMLKPGINIVQTQLPWQLRLCPYPVAETLVLYLCLGSYGLWVGFACSQKSLETHAIFKKGSAFWRFEPFMDSSEFCDAFPRKRYISEHMNWGPAMTSCPKSRAWLAPRPTAAIVLCCSATCHILSQIYWWHALPASWANRNLLPIWLENCRVIWICSSQLEIHQATRCKTVLTCVLWWYLDLLQLEIHQATRSTAKRIGFCISLLRISA